MGICFWYHLAFFLCNELDFHGWVLSKNDCRTQHQGCSLFPHLTIAFRTMVGLLDSISIWRHISWMSQTRAAGLRWKQRKTSNNSCCSFGPAWLFGQQGSVLSKALQHCTSHHCNEQICLLCPTPMILSSSVHTILSLTNVPSLLISTKHLSVWSSSQQLQLHQSALYPWLTTFGWCLLLFQTVFYHQVRSNTNPSLQSQMSNGFSIINPNQQVHQSITLDKVRPPNFTCPTIFQLDSFQTLRGHIFTSLSFVDCPLPLSIMILNGKVWKVPTELFNTWTS